ncbi:MAG: MEDS domain-containing protein [Luteimonas sp.]
MNALANDVDAFFVNTTGCAHVVHLYEKDDVFLDTLEGFTSGGLRAGEVVVLIATTAHLFALEYRLQKNGGWDVAELQQSGQYVAINAGEALAGFMRDSHVDESRFHETVVAAIEAAQAGGRRVRAFGEMVALLWASGDRDATRRVEELWNDVCRERHLSLLCAYPRQQPELDPAMLEICALHSQVLTS